jgi:ADP-ribose pyrophosphatase YjhB (NUDIX family)
MKAGKLRVMAVCAIWRNDAILVQEGYEFSTGETYYRLPGGGVEFGEYAVRAAVREIREELEAEVLDAHLLGVFENIFQENDEHYHEIIFVCEGAVAEPLFYDQDEMIGHEGDEDIYRALWVPLADFAQGRAILYPAGLVELLQSHQKNHQESKHYADPA